MAARELATIPCVDMPGLVCVCPPHDGYDDVPPLEVAAGLVAAGAGARVLLITDRGVPPRRGLTGAAAMPMKFLEDLKVGDVFGGQRYSVPRDEMIAFARKWDPRPIHLDDEAGRFLAGLRRRVALADAESVRVYGPAPGAAGAPRSAFLGIAHIRAGELIADRLLSPTEVAAIANL